jgi:hypothetical protein
MATTATTFSVDYHDTTRENKIPYEQLLPPKKSLSFREITAFSARIAIPSKLLRVLVGALIRNRIRFLK